MCSDCEVQDAPPLACQFQKDRLHV
jgi:hypothetical protein